MNIPIIFYTFNRAIWQIIVLYDVVLNDFVEDITNFIFHSSGTVGIVAELLELLAMRIYWVKVRKRFPTLCNMLCFSTNQHQKEFPRERLQCF